MATAHVPGEEFDFAKIKLQDPIVGGGRGAGYFAKATCDDSRALLFQTPPSFSKAGIVSTSRSNHVDILINKDSELAAWLGELEAHMIEEITQNASKWFTSPMTADEINYLLVPTSKTYKKQMYMRATLPVARYAGQGKGVLVFDESETPVPQTDILDSTQFIGVVEVAGMRFTTTAMRLELILKQIMVLGNSTAAPICLVRRSTSTDTEATNTISKTPSTPPVHEQVSLEPSLNEQSDVAVDTHPQTSLPSENKEPLALSVADTNGNIVEVANENSAEPEIEEQTAIQDAHVATNEVEDGNIEDNSITNDMAEHNDVEDNSVNEASGATNSSEDATSATLEEVVVDTPIASKATIDLKKKDEVYQDLYEELYERARDAKRYAIKLYLEAQELQTEHALDAIESSDDEGELEELLH